MPGRYDYWDYFEPSRPIKVEGGIKTKSEHGAIGSTWWSKRWVSVLESFNMGARLTRGRSYARQGQVLSIDVQPGLVKARVQGSRPRPYNVEIHLKPLSDQDWDKVTDAMADQALFAAKLLAGEMPTNIEEAFSAVQLSLFPTAARELETDCSCPDWANPCKHIAAVYYLLGEEFDRDPFLIFKLRGVTREEFTKLLGAAGAVATKVEADEARVAAPSEPLQADAGAFWSGGKLPDDFFGEVRLPPVSAALPKRLGNFPFWRGSERFLDALAPVYAQAAPHGLDVFLGESGSSSKAEPESPIA